MIVSVSNKSYVRKVNKLIPLAEAHADRETKAHVASLPEGLDEENEGHLWNRYFHREMQRLCERAGLRNPPPRQDPESMH